MKENAKEKIRTYLEKNRYGFVYGAYCGCCVLAGYMLGKHVASVRIGTGLDRLTLANPNLITEIKKAKDVLDGITNSVNKL